MRNLILLVLAIAIILFGCIHSHSTVKDDQIESIKSLLSFYADGKQMKVEEIHVISIDSPDAKIYKIEATASISTGVGITYFKLIQGKTPAYWAITSIGEKNGDSIEYHDVFPFIDSAVIDARKQLGL